jgi:hypothetical protein
MFPGLSVGQEVKDDVDVPPWSPRAMEASVGGLNRRERGEGPPRGWRSLDSRSVRNSDHRAVRGPMWRSHGWTETAGLRR